jgi:hypothetical protein
MEYIFKNAVGFNGIKKRIAKKSIRVENRVERKEISKYRLYGRRVTDGFIFFRGILLA